MYDDFAMSNCITMSEQACFDPVWSVHDTKAVRRTSALLRSHQQSETECGFGLSLIQSVGGKDAHGGAVALLKRTTLAGLGAQDDGELAARRFDLRADYVFAALDDSYTGVPELGLGLSDTDRDFRLGWRLVELRLRAGAGLGEGMFALG